jgi:protease I
MAGVLDRRRIAILAADGAERIEPERPRQALDNAGAFAVDRPVGAVGRP